MRKYEEVLLTATYEHHNSIYKNIPYTSYWSEPELPALPGGSHPTALMSPCQTDFTQ